MTFGLPGTIISRISNENLGIKLERHRPVRLLTRARNLILAVAAGLLAVTIGCGSDVTSVPAGLPSEIPPGTPDAVSIAVPASSETPTKRPVIQRPIAQVGDLEFLVELAADPEKRVKGLSGLPFLEAGTGMLFVFEDPERLRFWMRGMEISLDIVWISSDCRVVDVSEDVPFPDPDTPLDELPRYFPESPAQYVLEINGGEAAELGLGIGDTVEFLGGLAGTYGC
ncbi:MAG: DUF192 domain-containing protein [SAR202 cluster bacterium]|nr:DUF192 domain-containing protein [SAR202 cluster bacterium]